MAEQLLAGKRLKSRVRMEHDVFAVENNSAVVKSSVMYAWWPITKNVYFSTKRFGLGSRGDALFVRSRRVNRIILQRSAFTIQVCIHIFEYLEGLTRCTTVDSDLNVCVDYRECLEKFSWKPIKYSLPPTDPKTITLELVSFIPGSNPDPENVVPSRYRSRARSAQMKEGEMGSQASSSAEQSAPIASPWTLKPEAKSSAPPRPVYPTLPRPPIPLEASTSRVPPANPPNPAIGQYPYHSSQPQYPQHLTLSPVGHSPYPISSFPYIPIQLQSSFVPFGNPRSQPPSRESSSPAPSAQKRKADDEGMAEEPPVRRVKLIVRNQGSPRRSETPKAESSSEDKRLYAQW
jgi:hypothetical protein